MCSSDLVDVSGVVRQIGEVFGAYNAAAEAARDSLGVARELVELLGTPESRRDLSVSLDNVGSVAQWRGDLGEAADCFQESLGVARELADEQGTLQALKDLLTVLAHRARIADKAGDTAVAGQLTDEARRLDAVVTGGS